MGFVIARIVEGKLEFWCGKYSWGGRTFVQVYSDRKSADRAISRQQRLGRWKKDTPKIFDFDELWGLTDDNWQPLDLSDPAWA